MEAVGDWTNIPLEENHQTNVILRVLYRYHVRSVAYRSSAPSEGRNDHQFPRSLRTYTSLP